ncbi:MAG: glucose 1-dehydrogenase [Syntrophaceae bacterium]|nr:glucose 1-dehydrogenase [Syntrophaceae bacterium]
MVLDKFSLAGKTAIVIGASRGLGQGMARALGEAGADVALVARTSSSLEELEKELKGRGRRSLALPTDISQPMAIQRMVDRVLEAFGRIDILINSQGTQVRKPAVEMTEQDWDGLMAVNLKSVFFSCLTVGKQMIKQKKGKIINVASLTSVIGLPNISIYGASKGGVAQLTKALAVEWAPYRINVNAILPGYYETALTADLFKNEERARWVLSRIPLGRTGVPEDLAGTVVFLSSEASDYITGQIIPIDGGWLAS